VSTFLFWKNEIGLNFPVSDEMLGEYQHL